MATDEMRKKWGTIFMGERESSVEELRAMHERLNQEKVRKEQTEDYMERVRQRAADRAREILGAAYTERQKVLEEARAEANAASKRAAKECAAIKGEGEEIRARAQAELEKAQAIREEAENIRSSAHDEGYQAGMTQAGDEMMEFRAELGHALGALLRAIERERHQILENWREDLAELTRAATRAATGLVLRQEHDAMLRQLVFQALDHLESRAAISLRVNPAEEEQVSDMFRAAREHIPELKQWTVHGDPAIQPGGLVADSGSGSVDLRRENFQEMVENVLSHLALPAQDDEEAARVASLVEQEVAHIASMTPEPDQHPPVQAEEAAQPENAEPEPAPQEEAPPEPPRQEEPVAANPTLAELEDELFPLEDMENGDTGPEAPDAPTPEEPAAPPAGETAQTIAPVQPEASAGASEPPEAHPDMDSKVLSEGGFL